MATTVTPADAVVTLGVTLTLAGKTFDVSYAKTLSSCTRADRNIVPVPTSEIGLVQLTTPAAIGPGTFSDFNGFFVMNRDDTNFVRIRFSQNAGDTVDFKLEAGQFMILWNKKLEVNTTEAAFSAFVDFDTVYVQADTAAVDVEYLAVEI
jgi:hypothetical protein